MKKIYLLLVVLCTVVLGAQAEVSDEFTVDYPCGDNSYRVKYMVTGTLPRTVCTVRQNNYQIGMPLGMDIVIPEKVMYEGEEYTVTEVGPSSFYGWKGASFTLPNTVTTIGISAFSMSSIPTISIGTGVTTIGNNAFYESEITEITLPDGLKSMGRYCFYESALQHIVVPEGVTFLGESCFDRCLSLVSATLPSTLQTVPQACFWGCTSLTDLTLTPGIQTLYTQCFYGCKALTEVTIPASVTAFGSQSRPFHGCSNIRKVTLEWTDIPQAFVDRVPFDARVLQNATFNVPAGYEQAYAAALGLSTTDNINPPLLGRVFTAEVGGWLVTFKVIDDESMRCQVGDGTNAAIATTFTGTFSMPATVDHDGMTFAVTKVGDNAFSGCTALKGFTFSGITEVGANAFSGCTALTSFSFSGITKVGTAAFKNSGLASLYLATVATIGDEAFYGCKFTTVSLANVDVVGSWAFAYGQLTSVQFTSSGGNEARGAIRRGPGGGSGPSSIGIGSFSNNSIGSVNFSGSKLSEIPNQAFSNNQINSLDLGNVQSVGERSFYNNKLTKLNTKNVRQMGKEAFGKNQLQELEFGPGSENPKDFPKDIGENPGSGVDSAFGASSELAGLLKIVCGAADIAAIKYFFAKYGVVFVGSIAVTAVSAVVWKYLMDKRKPESDKEEDEFLQRDTPTFGFSDKPEPTKTCLKQELPYDMYVPGGMESSFKTTNCSLDESNKLVISGDKPGLATLVVSIKNKPGYHYSEAIFTKKFNVSDTDECDPDKDKIPTMAFIDRSVIVPRFAKYNVLVSYTNMTKEQASNVVFALKANPGSESVLDMGMLNYMTVTKKQDPAINGGWPYAEISTSWSPVSMFNLIGFARYLTATLDVQKYRNYHLTDEASVIAMETPNPNLMLYEDTVQVGDVIALPRFCDCFPMCWAMSPITIPASEVISKAGYQRYSHDERLYADGPVYHRGVPFIQYCDERGMPYPNPIGTGPAVVDYSRSNIPLAGSGTALNPDHEWMVDTVFVRANKAGRTILRFTDPYWPNLYFNMAITCVEPHTEAPASNPVTWDFTQPPTDELKDNVLRQQKLTKSTASYWTKVEAATGSYYSADMGFYGLRYGSSDRKWAPFFGNNGKNMPWFEGIEQSVETKPEDDQHYKPYDKRWHTAKDHIRIFDGRAAGQPQVAFVGRADLRIKKPKSLQTGPLDYVPFVVKTGLPNSGYTPFVTCSYTYRDEDNQEQTYSKTITPTADNTTLEFKLYGTVGDYISLSLTNVELSSICIDAPITITEQPQIPPTYVDGVYKPGTSGTYYMGSNGLYYIKDPNSGQYIEMSLNALLTKPYFSFTNESGSLLKLEVCNSQDAEIVVPETVPDNYPDEALRGQSFSVIAGGAFNGLGHLTKVTIGDNVNHIGGEGLGAFYGCDHLEELTIGSALDYLPYNSLNGCNSLKTFTTTSKREGIFEGLEHHAEGGLTVRCYHTTPITLYLNGETKLGKDYTLHFLDDELHHTYASTGICLYCNATEPGYFTALQEFVDNRPYIESKHQHWGTAILLDRTLYRNGQWNTICLPFDWDLTKTSENPLAGATARTLESASLNDGVLTITFGQPVTTLRHGVPYIIKWNSSDTNIYEPLFKNISFNSEMQPVETDLVTFLGHYNYVNFPPGGDPTKLYFDSDQTLHHPAHWGQTGALRAYFQLADGLSVVSSPAQEVGDGVFAIHVQTDVKLLDDGDNSAVFAKYAGKRVNVAYDRVLRATDNGDGTWTSRAFTVCLPYDLDLTAQQEAGLVNVYQAQLIKDNNKLMFTNASPRMEAGFPYIVVVNSGELSLNAQNVVLTDQPKTDCLIYNYNGDTKPLGVFRGTFTKIESAQAAAMFAYSFQTDGYFKRIRPDTPLAWWGAFRAMFCADAPEGQDPAVSPLKTNWFKAKFQQWLNGTESQDNPLVDLPADSFEGDSYVPDETSGINEELRMKNEESAATVYYTLDGRRLSGKPTQKGLYIINGKKIMK